MKSWYVRGLITIACCAPCAPMAATAPAATSCPPPGYDRAALRELRAHKFVVEDANGRRALALGLLACLADPDSELRDRIGYEAFAYWRHDRSLDAATWNDVVATLQPRLDAPADAAGVAAPFAALVLAEAVHADRNEPFLDAARRAALLDAAIAYFEGVRDYRGFDATTGWRHGVAHGADLLGELALEADFSVTQLERILTALATQVAAHDDHVYAFGESERLAAAAARVAKNSAITPEAWSRFLTAASAPAPFARWADAWSDVAGLAKRQNTMNFLLALYAELQQGGDAALHERAVPVAATMQPLR
jgi:hypothetical protein